MTGLNELSANEVAAQIADGATTSEAVVRDCLARIEEREASIGAWAFLDPALALEQAKACDNMPPRGPLHGVPIGVKDIFDTADMPTGMGSPIYEGYRPRTDAPCVALVRAAGAIILGKTVTAEFASMTPGRTTNPHNTAHTPGGSSSGSAAAVADFMVPVAFGTQTTGSTIRPASFCGIIGYKPTFGRFNRDGLKPGAQSLDTLGLFSRSLEDLELLSAVLIGRQPPASEQTLEGNPRIGLCRTPYWQSAQPETVEALENAAATLAAAGAEVNDLELPEDFAKLKEARATIGAYERGRAMAYEWHNCRSQLSERFRKMIQTGLDLPYEDYLEAQRTAGECRAQLSAIFQHHDILLTPSASGEAPEGLASTGDLTFQGSWTLLHVPCINLPTHKGPNGLPVGVQLVGASGNDDHLIAAARWLVHRLQ